MRMLFTFATAALTALAAAAPADAQSARATRAPSPAATGYSYDRAGLDFPYATSRHAYYDAHFDQYPEWAQKAFTPQKRN